MTDFCGHHGAGRGPARHQPLSAAQVHLAQRPGDLPALDAALGPSRQRAASATPWPHESLHIEFGGEREGDELRR
eukprot:817844-Pyramimonas_sp.AAC.1